MSFSTFAEYMSALRRPHHRVLGSKTGIAVVSNRWYSSWTTAAHPAAVPTTAAACVKGDSIWSSSFTDAVSGDSRIIGVNTPGFRLTGMAWIVDRLSHTGGLSGTTTGAQTTNLPTAALTRHTSGEGVWIALEIYTTIGTTARTVTVSYTNQAGTSGRTTVISRIGGVNFNVQPRFLILPLQAGDTGARSVQSVTLSDSTGTAGNFGVTLFKPLLLLPGRDAGTSTLLTASGMASVLPVVDEACLLVLGTSPVTVSYNDRELLIHEV